MNRRQFSIATLATAISPLLTGCPSQSTDAVLVEAVGQAICADLTAQGRTADAVTCVNETAKVVNAIEAIVPGQNATNVLVSINALIQFVQGLGLQMPPAVQAAFTVAESTLQLLLEKYQTSAGLAAPKLDAAKSIARFTAPKNAKDFRKAYAAAKGGK